jgi:2-polyprenyl-3-methyl-5-hydroxy-6-metoxy-1,4-benzoquinol methylase
LRHTFIDLGMSPLCESYVQAPELNSMERFYPLHAYVCEVCFLVQLDEYVSPEQIFTEYAYFSSYSNSWVAHAARYTDMIVTRLRLGPRSFVVEVASNDGYLLQHFIKKRIPVLGIEPAVNIALVAETIGVPTLRAFFGTETARRLSAQKTSADLIVGNNVLAQVPDLNDFIEGLRILLKPQGVVTLECPHLLRLMENNQFDTIYHEHFSYFSLLTLDRILTRHALVIYDVEELSTHGGSIRIFARHAHDTSKPVNPSVIKLLNDEREAGLERLEAYDGFAQRVRETKQGLLQFLIQAKQQHKSIAGYGAPGKGNTLLNYCGIRTDFVDYTVDRNPYKQGKFLPGTRIPIYPPEKIWQTKPDYVLILPWNFKDEIMEQMADIGQWGGQFVIPIPAVQVLSAASS